MFHLASHELYNTFCIYISQQLVLRIRYVWLPCADSIFCCFRFHHFEDAVLFQIRTPTRVILIIWNSRIQFLPFLTQNWSNQRGQCWAPGHFAAGRKITNESHGDASGESFTIMQPSAFTSRPGLTDVDVIRCGAEWVGNGEEEDAFKIFKS